MKSIYSIAITCIFLIGTIGVSVGIHYCGNRVHSVEVSYGIDKMGCGMEEDNSCENDQESITQNCCSNKITNYKVDDEYNSQNFELDITYDFAAMFVIVSNEILLQDDVEDPFALHYSPPPPSAKANIPVWVQSFLI